MNIIIDGNYAYHKAFSVFSTYYRGQDMELVMSDPDKQQVLIRKSIIDICAAVRRFADVQKVVVVFDSRSWRYKYYNNYKYALTKVRDPYYKYFLAVLDALEALLRKKGVIVSRVEGAEGDDLIYMWSLYFDCCSDAQQVVVITGDSDIRQIITPNVALFCNNSKNLKMYCAPTKTTFWSEYLADDVQVVAVKPLEVLLYKVIMGDASDNIPKIKTGFGPKAFEKFVASIASSDCPKLSEIRFMRVAYWIAQRFADFTSESLNTVLDKVIFNLRMTWLNIEAYSDAERLDKSCEGLTMSMVNDIYNQRNSYNYKGEYTLECFYNMVIK